MPSRDKVSTGEGGDRYLNCLEPNTVTVIYTLIQDPSNIDQIWIICLSLAILGTLFVLVRCVARWTQSKRDPFSLDDYLILPALIFALGTAACSLEATNYKGGRHLATLTLDDFIGLYKVVYAYTYFWIWSTSLTKLSILAFYRRIFGPSIQLWICVALAAGYFVSITLAWGLACRPVSFFWMEWITPEAPGSCFNIYKFDLANAIANLLIDLAVLTVPLPTIAKLQMPLRRKIGVAGVLLLGCFVSVASAVRLERVIYMNTHQDDISWSMGAVFVWSCVEPFVGIFCACLPTYPPLIRLLYRKFMGLPLITSLKSATRSTLKSTTTDNALYKRNPHHERGNHKIRNPDSDEELGLTNEIAGPGLAFRDSKTDKGTGFPMRAISVKTEVHVSSSHGDGGEYALHPEYFSR